MGVKELLTDELERQLGSLEDLPLGSQEYHQAIVDTSILLDKHNDMEKIELDRQEKTKSREQEKDLKNKEMKEERFDRIVKNVITVMTFGVSLGVTIWANVDSKKFEQGFTQTTEAGRSSTRKLLGLLDKFK